MTPQREKYQPYLDSIKTQLDRIAAATRELVEAKTTLEGAYMKMFRVGGPGGYDVARAFPQLMTGVEKVIVAKLPAKSLLEMQVHASQALWALDHFNTTDEVWTNHAAAAKPVRVKMTLQSTHPVELQSSVGELKDTDKSPD